MIETEKPVIRLRLWLETSNGILFGSGRAELLERVQELGSLKKAAESLGMSYRAAWGKIKQTEDVLGKKLIEKKHSNREGYELTPLGAELTRLFLAWIRDVEEEAAQKAHELFSFDSVSYTERAAELATEPVPPSPDPRKTRRKRAGRARASM